MLLGIIVAALTAIGALAIINYHRQAPAVEAPTVKVVASFYPLAEFAKQVGGERVTVVNVVPPGIKAHDFEPTPRDVVEVHSANVFLYHGSGFDPWAERIAPDLKNLGITVLNMTEHFELIKGTPKHKEEEKYPADEHKYEEAEKHKDEVLDPHIWLDPVLAQRMVELIRDTLQRADPAASAVYTENAERYLAALSRLHEAYQTGLAQCEIREAVASHAAFGYLAKRYNLTITNIAGISPKEEPSPRRVAEIADWARGKNIRYIFFETLVSPRIAETIAREIGAETLVFNPLEGLTMEELAAGENYLSIMEANLANLRRALRCR